MWLGEVCSCCSLTVLPGPAWILLNHVVQAFQWTGVLNSEPQYESWSLPVRRSGGVVVSRVGPPLAALLAATAAAGVPPAAAAVPPDAGGTGAPHARVDVLPAAAAAALRPVQLHHWRRREGHHKECHQYA